MALALAILLAGSAAAVTVGYILHSRRQGAGGGQDPRELLARADYEESFGYHARSLELLFTAVQQSRAEAVLLGALKRAWQVAKATGDFAPLARLSQAALERRPGSRRIAEVHVYAALRSELGGSVAEWLPRLEGRAESEPIVVEAHLRERGPRPGKLSGDMAELLGLRDERDPLRLEQAARLHAEARVWLDAALAWMKEGAPERAMEGISRAGDLAAAREALVYIAYDAGRYEQALETLGALGLRPPAGAGGERNAGGLAEAAGPELALLAADTDLLLGREAQAAVGYRGVVQTWPAYSWEAYLNLARLADAEGQQEAAEGWRALAWESFPEVEAVVMGRARDLAAGRDSERARAMVEGYLRQHADSVSATLLLQQLRGAAGSPPVYTAELWRLLRRRPEEAVLCRLLVLYLLGLQDLQGAEQALAEHEQAASGAGQGWVLEYRGVIAAMRGNLEAAAAALARSVELAPTWRRHYNLAVVQAASGNAGPAVGQLQQAEESLLSTAAAPWTGTAREGLAARSRIRSLIGEQLLALEDRQGARRECEYALDLDPLNHRARLILRILEGP